jgi:predicted peptidase
MQQPADPTSELNQNNAPSLQSRYVLEAYSSTLDPVTFYTELNTLTHSMSIQSNKKKQPMEAYSQNLIYSSFTALMYHSTVSNRCSWNIIVKGKVKFRCVGRLQHYSRNGLLYSDPQRSSFIYL